MTNPKDKPKTASLLTTMSPETLTLEDAVKTAVAAALVGPHPDDGEPILAQNGRYGPYLTWGKETRSLEDEDQIFTVDLERRAGVARPTQAARPPRGRGTVEGARRRSSHQEAGGRGNGRFGLFVTDGEVNATLRLGDTPETISLDRACELLAERRNAEPSTRPRKAVKKAAKKSPAKKATKKTAGATKRAAVSQGAKINSALIATAQHEDDAF
jgi:DNA topoisomerase-1